MLAPIFKEGEEMQDNIQLRYVPPLNIYHLRVNDKERPITSKQLDQLNDKGVTQLRDMALSHPWSWCLLKPTG